MTCVAEKDINASRDQEKIILSSRESWKGFDVVGFPRQCQGQCPSCPGDHTAVWLKLGYHYRDGTKFMYNIPAEDYIRGR